MEFVLLRKTRTVLEGKIILAAATLTGELGSKALLEKLQLWRESEAVNVELVSSWVLMIEYVGWEPITGEINGRFWAKLEF